MLQELHNWINLQADEYRDAAGRVPSGLWFLLMASAPIGIVLGCLVADTPEGQKVLFEAVKYLPLPFIVVMWGVLVYRVFFARYPLAKVGNSKEKS
ncbi:MAG: hypothetical protein WC343_13520 [Bacilli bacterium]|jgi:hypothetical protein